MMKKIIKKRRLLRLFLYLLVFVLLVAFLCITVSAAEDEGSYAPSEYDDFLGSLDSFITDRLPSTAFSDDPESIGDAAAELSDPTNILSLLVGILGDGLLQIAPTLALMLGIVLISALASAFSSSLGGLERTFDLVIRLGTFSVISAISIVRLDAISLYFERLFSAVASFIPLSATLFAMGGNLNAAVSNSTSLGVIVTVCEFFCTKTVIPVFCICLCFSLLSVFDGIGGAAGGEISASIKKWYTTALAFISSILSLSLATGNLIAVKADNLAMRGAKFAVSSFVPIAGGTISSTLGTLAASVELLRGGVGVIGIVVLLLLLLPTVIELALMRGVFTISSFCASTLGCSSEARLLRELESLYGYLEGIAALAAAVFIIAFGILARTATPFS